MDQFPQKTFKIKEEINAKQEVHAHVRKLAEEAFPCVSLARSHTDARKRKDEAFEEGKAEFDFSPSDSVCGSSKDQEGKRKKKKKFAEACTWSNTDIWLQRRVTQLFCWTQEEGEKNRKSRSPFLRGEDEGKDPDG